MEVFEIPSHKSELQTDNDSSKNNIVSLLQEAKENSKNGPAYIVEYGRAYFTAIYHCDSLSEDIIHMAYQDLHRGVKKINENIDTTLNNLNDEEEKDESLRLLYLNIIKIHIYCYTQMIKIFENKEQEKEMKLFKLKRKKSNQPFFIDKKQIILYLNNLIQFPIKNLWEPPIVEEPFTNLISEVCYCFLQNPVIKNEKTVLAEIWSFLGTLIKNYNHGKTFVLRIVQLIKLHEHLINCLPEGFKFLVDNYNSKSMIHSIVQEVTEWQTDEKYQDAQGARFCSSLLVEMSVLMPDMMIPEVFYLTKYLYYESPTLRNCVLSVITEIILKVLTKHDMNEEEKESRDEFLAVLIEHISDVSPLVRSKVFQHWSRLQIENAIPLKIQNEILAKAIFHLQDKGASVRKSAASLVTAFLSHNSFSFDLQLSKRKSDLEEVEAELKLIEAQLGEASAEEIKKLENEWNDIEEDIKKVIADEFRNEPELDSSSSEQQSEEDILGALKLYMRDKQYVNAVKLCRIGGLEVQAWKELGEAVNEESKIQMTLLLLKSVFIKPSTEANAELYAKFNKLDKKREFLSDTSTFLSLIDSCLEKMVDLLETTALGDMNEAVEFFITAYKFKIDRCTMGIVEMLRIMQRNEQERKTAITKAFQTIYLETDSQNISEHSSVILDRLIDLLKNIPLNNLEDLQNIVAEWAKNGIIDNGVIDKMWQYFTNKVETSMENRIAALELLRMAAIKRHTIITKNVKLISTVAFEKKNEKVQQNMKMVGTACKALSVVGREKIDVESKKTPFKINVKDEIFQSLLEILTENFFEKVDYYSYAIPSCINFIYQLCSKPETICENLLKNIANVLNEQHQGKMKDFQLVRFCQIIGCMATGHLNYMDYIVYKELKRRHNIREQKETQEKKKKDKKKTSNSNNNSKLHDSILSQNQQSTNDESTLEGAQAEDSDAEFILSILENETVTGSGLLGKLSCVVKSICQRPDLFDNAIVQGAAVTALIRYMLVSSRFCSDNMQLLFTIFEKTRYIDLKCTVLFHCSDLLSRFPNIVEPWTPKIYQSLRDPSEKIRRATFFTLSNLILREMIRVQGRIWEMAKCIIDEDPELNTMSRTFFTQLAHKENNLYSLMPDIFSHLIEELETDNVREIMKFMFSLLDKQKYMDNLVERFCCKFSVTEDKVRCRNIVYCLTLITYNDKALRKLQENFPLYKDLVHDDEIYANFKQILSNCSKQQVGKVDLKPIVEELEQSIESVFQITEGEANKPPARPVLKGKKNVKKAPQPIKRGRGAKNKRKQSTSSSEEESD